MAFGCDHPGGQTCNMLMSGARGRRGAGGRALHISEPCQHSAADGQRVGVSCGVRKAGRRQSFARAGTDVARGRADAKKSRLGPHAGGQMGCAKACCAHEQPGKASERARRPGDASGRFLFVQAGVAIVRGRAAVKISRSERQTVAQSPLSSCLSHSLTAHVVCSCHSLFRARSRLACALAPSLLTHRSVSGSRS